LKSLEIEQAVLAQIASDFHSPDIVAAYVKQLGNLQHEAAGCADVAVAYRDLGEVEAKIAKLSRLLSQTSEAGPLLRRIEERGLRPPWRRAGRGTPRRNHAEPHHR
jgi:hypothetical protein